MSKYILVLLESRSRLIVEINTQEVSNVRAKWWPNQASSQPKCSQKINIL